MSTVGTGLGAVARRYAVWICVARDSLEEIRRQIEEAILEPDEAGIRMRRVVGQRREHFGRVLEGLAVEQAGEQQIALVPQRQLVVEIDVAIVGEQSLGLQLDQGGRDQEELGGDLEVEFVELFEFGQVAVDDAGQRDLVEVDLLAENQVQEQVKWTFEHGSLNLVRHCRTTIEATAVGGAHPGHPHAPWG